MNKIGWIIIGATAIFLVALMVWNNDSEDSPQDSAEPWHTAMIKGDPEAPHSFVKYTDASCPFCTAFNTAASEGTFEEDYIESGKVRMEVRMVSLLPNNNSQRASESAYCAAEQDKFFDYYDALGQQFTKDYFDKNIGTSATAPKVPKLDDSYYLDTAADVGVDTQEMARCMDDNEQLAVLQSNTQKATSILPYGTGVPYFVINDFTSSGFGGDYSTVTQMMKAGGVDSN